MQTLTIDPKLLNPGFQSYKLATTKLNVKHHPLLSHHKMHYHSTNFSILEYCTKVNHLYRFKDELFYFDDQIKLHMMTSNSFEPICVYSFPCRGEFLFAPKLVIVSNYLVVSTGHDNFLYVLSIRNNGVQLEATLDVGIVESSHAPTLLDAKILDNRLWCIMMATKDGGDYQKQEIELTLVSSPIVSGEVQMIGKVTGKKAPHFAIIQPNHSFTTLSDNAFHLEAARVHETSTPVPSDQIHSTQYKWTQTDEEVTVHMTLSDEHLKHQLNITIQKETTLIQSLLRGKLLGGKLFDLVIPHESIWTLEDSKLLTVYFTKSNKRCRWSHLFAEDDGVLETLDSTTLKEYTDRLEKYTGTDEATAMKELLAMTEQSENIDFNGESCTLATYRFESGRLELENEISNTGMSWLCPVYGSPTKFVLKYDVDAAIFEMMNHSFKNVEVFAALGYIRASKREASLMSISEELDYCVILESKRHLYIYSNPQGEASAVHYVCDLWEGEDATKSLVIGMSLESDGLWVLKEDSLVRITFQ
jgi:hypothetical protein